MGSPRAAHVVHGVMIRVSRGFSKTVLNRNLQGISMSFMIFS